MFNASSSNLLKLRIFEIISFHILEKEGIAYETEAVEIIARRAEGGMRDALSILDQALSLTQDARLQQQFLRKLLGTISLSALDNYVAALAQKRCDCVLWKI